MPSDPTAPRWMTCRGCDRPFHVSPGAPLPTHAPSDDPRLAGLVASVCRQGAPAEAARG